MSDSTYPVVLAIAGSLLVSMLIVGWRGLGAAIDRRRSDGRAVQAAHRGAVPRLGGVAVMCGLVAAVALEALLDHGVDRTTSEMGKLLISALPVFLAGLSEDLGVGSSPRLRLFAAIASGALAIQFMGGVWLQSISMPLLDPLFDVPALAIPFTLFAAAGVTHAFNLIDGLNGLAAGTGIMTALGLASLSLTAGQPTLFVAMLLVAAALAGFLSMNFPKGRLFLGDGGAYLIGHLLVWTAITLPARAPEINHWALLLVFFWPVADTVLAIWRRRMRGAGLGRPDRMHVHQVALRSLEILLLGRAARSVANPLAAALLMPLIAAPIVLGVGLSDRPVSAALAIGLIAVAFASGYLSAVSMAASVAGRRAELRYRLVARVERWINDAGRAWPAGSARALPEPAAGRGLPNEAANRCR